MLLTLVRHATLLVGLDGRRLLVDPQLDPEGARPPIDDTPNPRRNPLVPLPMPAEDEVWSASRGQVTSMCRRLNLSSGSEALTCGHFNASVHSRPS
jgi:hypothetical protein